MEAADWSVLCCVATSVACQVVEMGRCREGALKNVELCGSLVTRILLHVNYQGVGVST